ncbi:MAG: Fe-S metabolism protein SufE [Bdellovibrionales bacterium RIFOXYB1_FULL_37_110]|nr:MAG: Fe-S metabolism protein SufE [Bdellovibrionales bacterium RIFOXYA1_FULL_38_20]OFZ50179.1 MAG: Fe-S metabolism protein SufE [Bdellovibrionales bacterium RIFOXYC1_FULL_37_79]OFZ57616.1 MAG: Fe-S metabolism protein SufE [Bdellovibrionales bacterium RIFOXYB1_FULL_37_110]OFZ61383.1 MAG: Fe-S metabolism protein SufE [Bdellovibrionales bacterium RIFOXYD1_FULL_36_51]
MSILDKINKLKNEFALLDDWESRYRLIIEMGSGQIPLLAEERVDDNLVKGCMSKVWLVASFLEGKVIFKGDSDASITKGLVSILVNVYSNETPDDIINTKPDFLDDLGIKEALSMNRASGLTAMLKQMRFYAFAYKAKMSKG